MRINPQFPERVVFYLVWPFHLYPLFMVFVVRAEGWDMTKVLNHYVVFTPLSLVLLILGSAASLLMKRSPRHR